MERKMSTANKHCSDRTTITRLQSRLAEAKTDKSKQTIKDLLSKAIFNQKTFCATEKSFRIGLETLKDFCKVSHSNNRNLCDRGFSLKVEGTTAISRCRKGRIWSDDFETCFLVDEYHYTSASDFNDDKSDPPGDILSSGRLGSKFYKLVVGIEVKNVSDPEKCN